MFSRFGLSSLLFWPFLHITLVVIMHFIIIIFIIIAICIFSTWHKGFKWHVKQVLLGLDQLANTLLGGWADETLSSRCYRLSSKYWHARFAMRILDFIFRPWGEDHCRKSYESELERKHVNPEMR